MKTRGRLRGCPRGYLPNAYFRSVSAAGRWYSDPVGHFFGGEIVRIVPVFAPWTVSSRVRSASALLALLGVLRSQLAIVRGGSRPCLSAPPSSFRSCVNLPLVELALAIASRSGRNWPSESALSACLVLALLAWRIHLSIISSRGVRMRRPAAWRDGSCVPPVVPCVRAASILLVLPGAPCLQLGCGGWPSEST